MFIYTLQDLLGISMTVPIISKHAREIGASPTVAGLIGKQFVLCEGEFYCVYVGYFMLCLIGLLNIL